MTIMTQDIKTRDLYQLGSKIIKKHYSLSIILKSAITSILDMVDITVNNKIIMDIRKTKK